jgi:hypothetical protein
MKRNAPALTRCQWEIAALVADGSALHTERKVGQTPRQVPISCTRFRVVV